APHGPVRDLPGYRGPGRHRARKVLGMPRTGSGSTGAATRVYPARLHRRMSALPRDRRANPREMFDVQRSRPDDERGTDRADGPPGSGRWLRPSRPRSRNGRSGRGTSGRPLRPGRLRALLRFPSGGPRRVLRDQDPALSRAPRWGGRGPHDRGPGGAQGPRRDPTRDAVPPAGERVPPFPRLFPRGPARDGPRRDPPFALRTGEGAPSGRARGRHPREFEEGLVLPSAFPVNMPDEEPPAAEQYFVEQPRARSARTERRFLYKGELLTFVVDSGIFASHGIDPGTALLIENLDLRATDRVLDLGCGWGAVGVAAAKAAPDGRVVL